MKTAQEMIDDGDVELGVIYHDDHTFLKPLGSTNPGIYRYNFGGHWCRKTGKSFNAESPDTNSFSITSDRIKLDPTHPDYAWGNHIFKEQTWISKEDFEAIKPNIAQQKINDGSIVFGEIYKDNEGIYYIPTAVNKRGFGGKYFTNDWNHGFEDEPEDYRMAASDAVHHISPDSSDYAYARYCFENKKYITKEDFEKRYDFDKMGIDSREKLVNIYDNGLKHGLVSLDPQCFHHLGTPQGYGYWNTIYNNPHTDQSRKYISDMIEQYDADNGIERLVKPVVEGYSVSDFPRKPNMGDSYYSYSGNIERNNYEGHIDSEQHQGLRWVLTKKEESSEIAETPDIPEGWTKWEGGDNPIPGRHCLLAFGGDFSDVVVESNIYRWDCRDSCSDITAYKLLPEKFPAPEGYEHTNECREPQIGETYISEYSAIACHTAILVLEERWILKEAPQQTAKESKPMNLGTAEITVSIKESPDYKALEDRITELEGRLKEAKLVDKLVKMEPSKELKKLKPKLGQSEYNPWEVKLDPPMFKPWDLVNAKEVGGFVEGETQRIHRPTPESCNQGDDKSFKVSIIKKMWKGVFG